MKVKLLMLLVGFFLSMGLALAQTSTVTGVVISEEDGEPVVGASVLVEGTTIGTVSDMDGNFTINNVPASGTKLMVSYIGMRTAEVAITPGKMTIILQSDSKALDEVVVTAQGLTRKEKSLGYSTQKVTSEDLTVARQTDLGNAMAGKIAGARFFGKSGATFDEGTIVLRGSTDFTDPAGAEPIYVIDGAISDKSAINMDDVESINVLKGSAATALYGSQGGNGAVIITTKGANGNDGKGYIEVSHTLTVDKYYNHFNMQKLYGGGSYGLYGEYYAQEFLDQYGDVDVMSPQFLYGTYGGMVNADGSYYLDYGSDESWGARYDSNALVANANYFDPTSSQYQQALPFVHRLNLSDLFRTALSNTTNVSFSKSGKDISTRISFTNSNREGIQQNSDAVRRYLSIKTLYKPASWLNVSLDYKYTYRRDHNGATEGYGTTGNVLYSFLQWGHTEVDLKDFKDYLRSDGSWRTWNIVSPTNLTANFHDNPYATLDNINIYNTSRYNVFTADAEALLPYNLKLGMRVMGNMLSHNEEDEYGEGSINFTPYYGEEQYHQSDLTLQGRLTWSDRFVNDRLSLDAAAFLEQRQVHYGLLSANTTDGLIMNGYYNLAASNGYVSALNDEYHYKTQSIFATATAGFDDTYFLDGSVRNDWDSRLPDSNNSYLYGGLSASVMLNQFIHKAPWLNYWKVRASMAQVGSTLDVYNTIVQYQYTNSDNDNFKYNSLTSLYQSSTQLNQDIKPTISTSYEIGTEARVLNNRLWADINLYRRDTKNQILNMTVAPQSGYASRQLNSGLVRNQGVELMFGATPVLTKDFQWDITANFAKNDNKLIRLNEDITTYMLEGNSFYYYWYLKAEEGKPLGVITTMARWARNEDGQLILTPTTSSAWGGGYQPTYEFNVEKEVGNYQPDWTGGFSTNFRYKNLSLSASFDFMIGGSMVSWTNLWSTGSGLNAETAKLNDNGVNEREPIINGGGVKVEGVDTDGNPVTCYMNAYYYYHYKAYYDLDSWVYSRSYLKMRELSLTYDFPKSILSKANIGLTNASLSFVASNPWLIYSACPNVDPSETGDNWLEGGQAASTRSFGFTVKLGF